MFPGGQEMDKNSSCPDLLHGNLIMKNFIKTFLSDNSGAAAAEYALILAVVGGVIAVAASGLATAVGNSINRAANTVNSN
jgi:pilus assembly protein Flp/PilA